jgi:cell shape-determining protein MreC
MDQIFSGIANNIWVLIPLVAIIGGIGSGMLSSVQNNKKLQEENEYLKHLLAQKDQQLLQNEGLKQRIDQLENKLLAGK